MGIQRWIELGLGKGYPLEAQFRQALLARYRSILGVILVLEVGLLFAFSMSDLLWANWQQAAVLWQWRLLPTLPGAAMLAVALKYAGDERFYSVIRWHALILGLAVVGVIFAAWDMKVPLPQEGLLITILAIFAASGLLLLDALFVTGVVIVTYLTVGGMRYGMDARWQMDGVFLVSTWCLGGFSTLVRDVALRQIHRAFVNLSVEAANDYLTKTSNRRQLVRELKQLWRRAQRHQWTLAVMLIDLDHFKYVNDNLGHDTGDDYLADVASVFSSSFNRADDIVGRYGGEEFVVASVVKDREHARRLCQMLVERVRALKLPNAANDKGIQTVSIGCVVVGPTGLKLPWTMAIKLADMLMYLQKTTGRDGFQIAKV